MYQLENVIFNLYPEFLVLFALIISIILSTTKFKECTWVFSAVALIVSSIYVIQNQLFLNQSVQVLGGALIYDTLSNTLRLLILLISILIVFGSVKYSDGFIHKGEFQTILLSAILGGMFLVSANDLITIFVALETIGLSSILLSGYSKYDRRSNEASLKYLLNSASATGIFLFGLSLIYGFTGSTQLYEIKYILTEIVTSGGLNPTIILVIIILIVGGIGFKLASAPFHMWSPDVYEGSPTPTTAFIATISKISAIAVLIRLFCYLFDFAISTWQPILIFISILSMLVGNLVALAEVRNKASIKRLMAYSSIAQIGYIMSGIVLSNTASISASIYYLIVYTFVNIGAFLCIIAFGNEANSDSILDYKGLIKKRPYLTIMFAIFLFNLAGLPFPPAGFIAKFFLIKAVFESGTLGIIIGTIILLTTLISVYYYTYIVKLMITEEPSKAVNDIDFNKSALGYSSILNTAITVSVISAFLLSIYAFPTMNIAKNSAKSFGKKPVQILSLKN